MTKRHDGPVEAEPSPSWTFVVSDGVDLDIDVVASIVDEAAAAAPDGVLEGGELLPRVRSPDASCRICGATEELSREHIPPRTAGNSDKRSDRRPVPQPGRAGTHARRVILLALRAERAAPTVVRVQSGVPQ